MTDFKQYLRSIRRGLKCAWIDKRRMLRHFKSYMLGFSEQSKTMRMEELVREFGPPEEVAQNYMECLTEKQLRRYRIVRWIPKIILFLLFASFLLFWVVGLWPNENITSKYTDTVALTQWTPPEYFDSTELYPESTPPDLHAGTSGAQKEE